MAFHHLFSIFNTKHAPVKGKDAPLSKAGWAETTKILSEGWNILSNLRAPNGKHLYLTARNTPIYGLCGNIIIVQMLVGQLGDIIRLEYILFYRVCQGKTFIFPGCPRYGS